MIRDRLKRLAGKIGKRISGQPAPERPSPPPITRPPIEPEEEVEPVDLEIDAVSLQTWLDEERKLLILDVREPRELRSGFAQDSFLLPMNQVPQRLEELPHEVDILVVCAAGARSFGVAHYLREQGFEKSWSLSGGVGDCFRQGIERRVAATEARFQVLDRVEVTLPDQEELQAASVQDVLGESPPFRYRVRLKQTDNPQWVFELPEEAVHALR
ncbi:MAG: rhodanese-related sulfurtransferase [Cognaticolwellia sp.]|jgi:rhodanese-related sulfurtransferase